MAQAQPSPSLLGDPTQQSNAAQSSSAANRDTQLGNNPDAIKGSGTDGQFTSHTNATTGQTTFDVNTDVAKNPYLAGDISAINNQAAAIQGQSAAQTTAAQATAAQAQTPSPSLVAQSAQTAQGQGFMAQSGLVGTLQNQIAGRGPSASLLNAQQVQNQGINAQLALAGSARGGNAGEMARQAAMGQAQVTGQAANQAAQIKIQEQQNAINNLGNVSGAMQGEEQQNNQFNAGATNQANSQTQQLQQQTALANQQATNTAGLANQQATNTAGLANQQATNTFQVQQDQMIQSLMNNGMSLEQAQQQANVQMAEYATGAQADQQASQQGHAISQQNADTNSANAALTGVGMGLDVASKVSDKRAKKDIKDAGKESSAFLDHLEAKSWNYKDPEKHGLGRYLGVMAQDLEKSKMGKAMVKTGPDGVKMVEYGGAKGMAAIVASLAHLNEKLKKLEEIKARSK